MALIALVTGASSGFGRMIARDLAHAGHTAYASMRETSTKNADKVADNAAYAARHGIQLASTDLDVQDETSIRSAVDEIIARHGRIDILVQNAGHMVYGPSESFTPQQLSEIYDVNVVGTQRVSRAVLPHMRAAGRGLIVWAAAYPSRFAEEMKEALAATVPASADPRTVARAVVDIVSTPYGKRPLRVVIDPAGDGSVVSFAVIDRVRSEFLHRIGHAGLLHPWPASDARTH